MKPINTDLRAARNCHRTHVDAASAPRPDQPMEG